MKTASELLSKRDFRGFSSALVSWYTANQKDWPWRSRFRDSGSPYPVWISEIMLQQTTIQAVLPAYQRFMDSFPTVESLAAASEDAVREACRGLGYYRRFRMMHAAANEIVARGSWPRDFLGWKELPGIGDYTAAAISSIAFGFPKAVVDGNVERVMARIFNLAVVIDAPWKKVFQNALDQLVISPSEFNQGLMELGQTVCFKGTPRCSLCPVAEYCGALSAGTQNEVPLPKIRDVIEDVRVALFVVEKRGRIGLLQRRADAKFLRGTWSFPSALILADGLAWETSPLDIALAEKIAEVRHGITKHRIAVDVHALKVSEDVAEMKWVLREELEAKLVSNMDRKAFLAFEKWQTRGKKSALPLESLFLQS